MASRLRGSVGGPTVSRREVPYSFTLSTPTHLRERVAREQQPRTEDRALRHRLGEAKVRSACIDGASVNPSTSLGGSMLTHYGSIHTQTTPTCVPDGREAPSQHAFEDN